MNAQINDAYFTLGWVINRSDEGMFLLSAPEAEQREVAEHYKYASIAIYDCRENPGIYHFANIEKWIAENDGARVYFLLNLQLALFNAEDKDQIGVQNLNFSRDMLMRLHKNIVFCVTEYANNLLIKRAPDLYSFFKLKIKIDAVPEEQEEVTRPEVYDLSTGDVEDIQVDFTQPRAVLLAQAIGLINKAHGLSEAFRFKDARIYLEFALRIRTELLGEDHPDTATVYFKLGSIYDDLCDYNESIKWYLKAIEVFERTLGYEHPDTAGLYNNIGIVYHNQGNYPKMLEYCQKALVVYEKIWGKEHPDTATLYENIGVVYYEQGDYPKALEYYQEVLVIRERVLGAEHPDMATSYNNIGVVCMIQGDYPKALEYYQKALKIFKNVFGKEHPNTAISYDNISRAYHFQGDYLKALEYSQKAKIIFEKVLGTKHPDTAKSYNNISFIYKDQGNYPKALEYFQKALTIYENVLGTEHPLTKETRQNISLIPTLPAP